MHSWTSPPVPVLPGTGAQLSLFDTATGTVAPAGVGDQVGLYVCGITPYDATHLGHAATYLAFDLAQRVWRDAGKQVRYVQNVTDVDDPLIERAARPVRPGTAWPPARSSCSGRTWRRCGCWLRRALRRCGRGRAGDRDGRR